jgi:hypothetical protein
VLVLTGPRQSGKTTLARRLFPRLPYATLESPDVRALAADDPRAFLARYPQGALLDEVQRAPELFSYLQETVDAAPHRARFVLTGSSDFALLQSVSQSLAGRAGIARLLPLTLTEAQTALRPQTATMRFGAAAFRGRSRAAPTRAISSPATRPPISNATCGRSSTCSSWARSSASCNWRRRVSDSLSTWRVWRPTRASRTRPRAVG